MRDDRDYKLDLAPSPYAEAAFSFARPFLSVRFACCNVYCRIYRSLDGRRYDARCPRCARPVSFVVGEGGTDARFFVVE